MLPKPWDKPNEKAQTRLPHHWKSLKTYTSLELIEKEADLLLYPCQTFFSCFRLRQKLAHEVDFFSNHFNHMLNK